MNKLLILLCLMAPLAMSAQTVNEIFRTMPSEMFPGFTEANKTMLLVDTGHTVVPYALGQVAKEVHTADYLRIKTSDIGTLQLKLLPLTTDSIVVCIIRTVCAPACDSHIAFYTPDWVELDAKNLFPTISKEIFYDYSQKNSDNYKYAVSLPDISPIAAEFADGSTDLTLKLDVETHLSDNDRAAVNPFLTNNPVTLRWQNGSFR